ncbi:MAG: hypothetical protein SFU99_03965 [Saprospiraceae bacterium]|nr:hypothetical protein [Saprospiraceae bacterium]
MLTEIICGTYENCVKTLKELDSQNIAAIAFNEDYDYNYYGTTIFARGWVVYPK